MAGNPLNPGVYIYIRVNNTPKRHERLYIYSLVEKRFVVDKPSL